MQTLGGVCVCGGITLLLPLLSITLLTSHHPLAEAGAYSIYIYIYQQNTEMHGFKLEGKGERTNN